MTVVCVLVHLGALFVFEVQDNTSALVGGTEIIVEL